MKKRAKNPDVVVGSGKSSVFGRFKKSKKPQVKPDPKPAIDAQVAKVGDGQAAKTTPTKSRKKIMLTSLFVFAILLLIGMVSVLGMNKSKKANATACNDAVVKEAVPLLAPTKLNELRSKVSTIKDLKNYQGDPNCMYIVTTYYVNFGDEKNARSSLDTFNKTYAKHKTLSQDLTASGHTAAALQASVDFTKKYNAQIKTNLKYAPIPK